MLIVLVLIGGAINSAFIVYGVKGGFHVMSPGSYMMPNKPGYHVEKHSPKSAHRSSTHHHHHHPTSTAASQQVGTAAPQQQINISNGSVIRGTINSLIFTPGARWIATGNWIMNIDDGRLKDFATNMTWFNNNGNTSHTHEFRNLRSFSGEPIVVQQHGNNIIINGLMDVGTNHRIVWKNVPTMIKILGEKTIEVAVADNATNHHFAGQPVYGVVTSITPCSGVPGPNMQTFTSCTGSRS